jgi:hypothetical protein
MLGAVCREVMDEIGTGTCIAFCSVLSSMDGSGESESSSGISILVKEDG